jgi:mRNA-degrading endonuclease RelE of RelBE toxin-antitoxin system
VAPFSITLHPGVRKELRRLWKAGRSDVVERFRSKLDPLAQDPQTLRPGLDIRRLSGIKLPTFRLRIGDYRAVYEVDERERVIRITALFRRRGGYPP